MKGQPALNYIDTGYIGYFEYLLNVLDELDPHNTGYIEEGRIQLVESNRVYDYSNKLKCVEYLVFDLGNGLAPYKSDNLWIDYNNTILTS